MTDQLELLTLGGAYDLVIGVPCTGCGARPGARCVNPLTRRFRRVPCVVRCRAGRRARKLRLAG